MTKAVDFTLRHRAPTAAILLTITAVFGFFAAQVKFDNTIESYFLPKDLTGYNKFLHQFGSDEIIAIAFDDEKIMTPDNLRLISGISSELKKIPHVRRVISLTTVKIAYGDEDSTHFERLVPRIPDNEKELARIERRAMSDPFVPGILISPDGKNTAIVAEIEHIVGQFDYKVALLNRVRALLAQKSTETGRRFYLAGTAVLDEVVFRYTKSDQATFFPFIILIIVAVMYLMFRMVGMTALPLAVAAVSAAWTYGLMFLLGFKVNVITTIIGPLLMAVAIADSMHIIADYLQEAAGNPSSRIECIHRAFKDVIKPCLMTSLTTMAGLLSLVVADLAPIRQFGLVAAAGVLFAFCATVLLLPILLSVLPFPNRGKRFKESTGLLHGILSWLERVGPGRAWATLAVCACLAVPAGFSLANLEIGTNSLDYLTDSDPVRKQIEWIDSHIGGTVSLEFFIDAHHQDALKDPALLKKMERFQNYLAGIDGITGVYSAVDLVKALNRAYQGGKDSNFTIPDSRAAIAQELMLVEGDDDFDSLLSRDYSKARISARVEMNKSRRLGKLAPKIERRMREIFGSSANVKPTGLVYLMHRMEHYILTSQIKSFALAFLVVLAAIMIMLRSFKLGLVAIVPNLLPVMFTLALMPILKIPLDVGTVMIAGVALGLVVDDTIHLLARLRIETDRSGDIQGALAATLKSVSRPIVFTSLVLSIGFLVLLFASFRPVIHFGVLASIVIIMALVFDLLVTPAIVRITGRGKGNSTG
jgi:uncharacterized protein